MTNEPGDGTPKRLLAADVRARDPRRPKSWDERRARDGPLWLLPLQRVEWGLEWAVFGLRQAAIVELVQLLASFSLAAGAVAYCRGADDRERETVVDAWAVISNAKGDRVSGARDRMLELLAAEGHSLARIDLRGASLEGIDLRGADLRYAALDTTLLTRARLDCRPSPVGRWLPAALARRVAPPRCADLRYASLQHAYLGGANLAGADLSGATLRHAELPGATLANAKLLGTDAVYATFRAGPSPLGDTLPAATLDGATLDRASLDTAELGGARLRDVSARGTSLHDADLTGAALDGADLEGAALERANLAGASLVGARRWRGVRSLARANVAGVRGASADFRCWAVDTMRALDVADTARWRLALDSGLAAPAGSACAARRSR